jgi:sialate O-acetylesterase
VIAVRILDRKGSGGIYPSKNPMQISLADKAETIDISGPWQYRIERVRCPLQVNAKKAPARLYNGMIAPLVPYGIKGVIWYQGESNAERAYQYRNLFPAMIRNWRSDWDMGDFPFYFVQLANFGKRQANPGDSDWAELREAQLLALSLPNTGMAVTIDAGDAGNIHPRDKQTVGHRLALIAQAKDYNQKVTYSGPIYRSMEVEAGQIRLHFDHVDSGLISKDGPLTGFAIAGEDRKFYWAEVSIEGQSIVVRSDKVPNPVAVRYAWDQDPACNLYNWAGLPATPFRTDEWPGVTVDKR